MHRLINILITRKELQSREQMQLLGLGRTQMMLETSKTRLDLIVQPFNPKRFEINVELLNNKKNKED